MISKQKKDKITSGKYFLGVTGSIGCGKTYTCEKLCLEAALQNINLIYLNLDRMGKDIIGTNPLYLEVRKALSTELGIKLNPDSSLDKEKLSQLIFNNSGAMKRFRKIINPATSDYLRRQMSGKTGLFLIEWALLVEDKALYVGNNNVLLVTCDYDTQIKRLKKRGLSLDQIIGKMKLQLTNEEKASEIRRIQEETKKGSLYLFDTSDNPKGGEYKCLLKKMITDIVNRCLE